MQVKNMNFKKSKNMFRVCLKNLQPVEKINFYWIFLLDSKNQWGVKCDDKCNIELKN